MKTYYFYWKTTGGAPRHDAWAAHSEDEAYDSLIRSDSQAYDIYLNEVRG